MSSGGNVEGRNSHVHWNGRTSKPSASTRLLFAFSTMSRGRQRQWTVDGSHLCLMSQQTHREGGKRLFEMEAF